MRKDGRSYKKLEFVTREREREGHHSSTHPNEYIKYNTNFGQCVFCITQILLWVTLRHYEHGSVYEYAAL